MYSTELEIKDTTESNTFAFFLDEVHFRFSLIFSPKGWSASTLRFPLRQTWLFQFLYPIFFVPQYQHPIYARLWRFYLTDQMVHQGLLLYWALYSKGNATFEYAWRVEKCHEMFEIVSWKVRYKNLIKRYNVPISRFYTIFWGMTISSDILY